MVSDPDLTVIVFVKPDLYQPDQWWPHKETFVNADGTWQGRAQIGDRPCWSAGHHFEIVAVVMTRDQAERITAEFQPLPRGENIARSNPVGLVTTYDSVPINLSVARESNDAGSDIALSAEQTSLEIDYDLGMGGWVLVTVPLNQDISCMRELGFSVSFSLQGTGEPNSLEAKLEDADGTTFGWRRPRGSVTADLEFIELSFDLFEFWWDSDDKDKDMDWQQVMNIQFAVSRQEGDAGGAGRVVIRDVVMAAPVTP